MPEIAEVARTVHFLKKALIGKTLSTVNAIDDGNVFGKVGTSGAAVQKALTGKKVVNVGQQGKYFWIEMSSSPHLVMHFGMTGRMYIRGEKNMHYRSDENENEETWPPKYWKFTAETNSKPKDEIAFTDSRRFGRVRLVECEGKDLRNTTPLKENGPDPVIDKDVFSEEFLEKKMKSKHVPIKALLLDQANISGIGNWVGDEVLYHARLHPEQYSDTFSSSQIKQLHASIVYICQTAVDVLADHTQFPDEWMFKHRWGKGKKDAATTLPNGEKIIHITVGGRTSCVCPTLQKKTGAVAGDVKKEVVEALENGEDLSILEKGDKGKASGKKRKASSGEEVKAEDEDQKIESTKLKGRAKKSKVADDETFTQAVKSTSAKVKKQNTTAKTVASENPKKPTKSDDPVETKTGRRRSGRVTNGKS